MVEEEPKGRCSIRSNEFVRSYPIIYWLTNELYDNVYHIACSLQIFDAGSVKCVIVWNTSKTI